MLEFGLEAKNDDPFQWAVFSTLFNRVDLVSVVNGPRFMFRGNKGIMKQC